MDQFLWNLLKAYKIVALKDKRQKHYLPAPISQHPCVLTPWHFQADTLAHGI